ncbi:AAA family ATPase [Haliangium sp.]|uniref:AAA family ATPase n=1 Tax=Haliangium sp. TaxID=2663208 RepID=UPI003D11E6B1
MALDYRMPSRGARAWDVRVRVGRREPSTWEIRVTAATEEEQRKLPPLLVDEDEFVLWLDSTSLPREDPASLCGHIGVRYVRRHLDDLLAAQDTEERTLGTAEFELLSGPGSGEPMRRIEHEIDTILDVLPEALARLEEVSTQVNSTFSLDGLPPAFEWTAGEPALRRLRDQGTDLGPQEYDAVAEFYSVYGPFWADAGLTDKARAGQFSALLRRADDLGHVAVRALYDARNRGRAGNRRTSARARDERRLPDRAVHFRSLTIERIRCFDHVSIALTPPADENKGQWIVLLGENGTGKTTLLRALALALLPEQTARNYLYDISGDAGLTRDGPNGRSALVRVELAAGDGDAVTEVAIVPGDRREDLEVRVALDSPQRPLVLGYGCRRGSALGGPRRESNTDYLEGADTLFNEDARVISADTWLRDLRDENSELFENVCRLLADLLPGVDSITVESRGPTRAKGPVIGDVPLAGLSDGYLTTLGWLVDVLARFIDYFRSFQGRAGMDWYEFYGQMPCVVLIDELDLHLHPRWQAEVIRRLREHFPMTTFVATTHNPLTLHGTEAGEVHVIRMGEGGALELVQEDLPPGIRTDELLTGDWFGLPSTLDVDTQRLLREHFELLRQGRHEGDPERVALEQTLRERLGHFAATPAQFLAEKVVAEELDSYAKPVTDDDRARVRARYRDRLRAATRSQGGDEP